MCKAQGLATGTKHKAEISNRPASGAGVQAILAIKAGGPCKRLTQAECFSLAACSTVCLLVAVSSISARIACRSSVAEITGKSSTTAQPSVSRHCSAVALRATRASPPRRQSQKAGSASNIHARLSSNSIQK
jgi:hypothetical protein